MNADGRDKRGFAAWAWVDLLLTAEVGPLKERVERECVIWMRRCDSRGVLKKEIATLTGSVGSEVMGPIPNLEIQICGKAGGLAQLSLVLYPEHGRESIPLTYPLLSELLCPPIEYI